MMRRSLKIVPLLPLLAGGCMTHRLWTQSAFDDWNGPAASPNLRLFHDAQQPGLLVVYDEYSERHQMAQARAYFLYPDLKPPARNVRPHFVDADLSRGLTPVPVLFRHRLIHLTSFTPSPERTPLALRFFPADAKPVRISSRLTMTARVSWRESPSHQWR